jgi:hypothetical protein
LSLEWFLTCVLRSLLALLLMAGPLTAQPVRAANGSFDASDDPINTLLLAQEQALDDIVETQSEPDHFDSDTGPGWSAVLAGPVERILDRTRSIRIGRVSYPAAPPNHRPCAAPPTGPPLA